MYLKVYNDNGTVNKYEIKKELLSDIAIKDKVSHISSSSKEQSALNIFKSYFSNAKSILFDANNALIVDKLKQLNIQNFELEDITKTIFDNKEFALIYFTSGSTGESTAALKTKENIESEIKAQTKLLKQFDIKRVIVTVPFIHIYGSLWGLFYPYFNDIDIIIKEHFLPNDLLDMCEENSLIVTKPLYIKALNRTSSKKNLSKCLFLSSTAPLNPHDAKIFIEKFSCNLLQLYGSTETGGVAYKLNNAPLWTPLQNVKIKTNKQNELKVISPFVSKTIFEKDFKDINGEFQTFDYIEKINDKFKLIGRSSQILKVAGKRYSTTQIEDILEAQENIEKALVYVKNGNNSLRGEVLDITLESKKEFSSKEIKKLLQSKLSNLKFSIDLKHVKKIATSSVGKKLRI